MTYWFRKGWQARQDGAARVGFVSTNSIRGGANRDVLRPIAEAGEIVEAWSDEPWVVDGAAVRVSLVAFGANKEEARLNGAPVGVIHSDLTAGLDLTSANQLPENASIAFMGDTKGGAFDVPGQLAREWLQLPSNPNGRPNADVLKPWLNGMDISRRYRGNWIIDFGWKMSEAEASLYEAPFTFIEEKVKPVRAKNKRETYRTYWWRHVEARQGMWEELSNLERCIVTPEVSRQRVWSFLPTSVIPDHKLQVIARDDYSSFGILASKIHLVWSLAVGNWHGKGNDPRYTITTCFRTFAFPDGLTPDIPAEDYAGDPRAQAIAEAARRLDDLRERWLNPPEWTDRVPEVVPGYPDRVVPKDEEAAKQLKARTLTNLYNERPAWLDHAHRDLDRAVAAAYGWAEDFEAGALTDKEVLARLFALNQARAGT